MGPLGKKYEAFAALCKQSHFPLFRTSSNTRSFAGLKDLVDDESTEIRIPIVIAEEDGGALRQNYLSDQTQKTHKYTTVGWLVTTVHLDSGLDEDHEQYATTQTQRHEFETYDRIVRRLPLSSHPIIELAALNLQEGQAASAESNSHANDDGVVDKEEQRAIDRSHKKALESRHRGVMQYRPVRTLKWAKDGGKDRIRNLKDKLLGNSKKDDNIATEAAS